MKTNARFSSPVLFLALFSGALWNAARGQDAHQLTLQEALETAVDRSYAASSVRARYESAKKSAESALRRNWTSVTLSATAPEYSQSLSQQFNPLTGFYDYYRLKSSSLRSFLTISQPIHLTGGTLSFSQSLFGRDQTTGLAGEERQTRDFFGSYSVEYQQPILTPNLLAIEETRTRAALEQAEAEFARDQLDLVYSVSEAFYSVYQLARRVEIVREQVKQTEESYTTARNKAAGGLIPEVEALQAEVDLSSTRNDLLGAERELARAKNSLRLLLGIPPDEEVEVAGEIAYRPVEIDLDKAVASALEHRAEVLAAHRSVALADAEVGSARSSNGFRIDLVARYGLNKRDTLFRNLFQDFDRTNGVSLSLSIPIFNWGSHGLSVEAAEVRYHDAERNVEYIRQQVRQEIGDLVNRVRVAESRIRVLERAADVAKQGWEISLERFRNGTITRNDLSLAQQRLTTARTNTLNALVDYQLGLEDLKRRTLWDFEIGAPVRPVLSPP